MVGRVMEVGAGRRIRPNRFQPTFESVSKWLFVDISPERHPHCQADVQRLPFRGEMFDTVLCLEMLEYVKSPQAALQEIHRVLKTDGTLILTLPFLHHWDSEHDYWRLTLPGLELLLHETGFLVESIEAQGGPLAVIVNIVQFILVQQPRTFGWCLLCGFLYPLLRGMESLDSTVSSQSPIFPRFTTGYRVLAKAA